MRISIVCRSVSVVPVNSLASALRQKTAPLALDLGASEDLQCRNLLCERVGDPCICRLSHALESLTDVRHLSLASNKLTALPTAIWKQKNLTSLDLSDNQLSSLPDEAKELINLQILDVRGNDQLQTLPAGLSNLSSLKVVLPGELRLRK